RRGGGPGGLPSLGFCVTGSETRSYVTFLRGHELVAEKTSGKECLLCRRSVGTFRSRSHAFPEAIYPNGPCLPPGVICDPCNHYVGTKLEPVLLGYPLIALPLQVAELPGKKGKARKRIGIFDREVVPEA